MQLLRRQPDWAAHEDATHGRNFLLVQEYETTLHSEMEEVLLSFYFLSFYHTHFICGLGGGTRAERRVRAESMTTSVVLAGWTPGLGGDHEGRHRFGRVVAGLTPSLRPAYRSLYAHPETPVRCDL